MFTKGDILLPLGRVAKQDWINGLYHPAVVWDAHYDGNNDFNGIMITHSQPSRYFQNILMAATHFENGYKVGFSNSHFVDQLFIKFHNWAPFELVGRLTSDGVNFITKNLSNNQSSMEFTTYRQLLIK